MIMNWFPVRDGDIRIRNIYEHHYSCEKITIRGQKNWRRICPPGEHLILLTPYCDALFVWNKGLYRMDDQVGVNCTIFRNESNILSSLLITEAVELAWSKWPGDRLFTFVNPKLIQSTNPGYCFIKAGWKRLNYKTPKGLVILELLWH